MSYRGEGLGAHPGPIDRYLDRLLSELTLDASHTRRVLAEAEDHLRETAREIALTGTDAEAAERQAVERFGPPGQSARV